MKNFNTSGIVLRAVDYGDYDRIITFLTPDQGRIAVMARAAHRRRELSGILELFTSLEMVCRAGRGRLPLLHEAALIQPFPSIRMSIRKAAPAGYWAEMILNWLEDGAAQPELFRLFSDALTLLDRNIMDPAVTSILFQVHFMRIAGISPCLTHCIRCCTCLDDLRGMRAGFDPVSGGLVCGDCIQPLEPLIRVSQGTVRQLLWGEKCSLQQAARLRFAAFAVRESEQMLEAFVSRHLGRDFRSLAFLRQMRGRPEPVCGKMFVSRDNLPV